MDFKSFNDLTNIIRANLHTLPNNFQLIVGIPRSGMLPASIIALLTDRPLLDLESFLRGHQPGSGSTRVIAAMPPLLELERVLVVDDSISSGGSLQSARNRIAEAYPSLRPSFMAVYATPPSREMVDIHFAVCPHPRVFEWNLLNSWVCRDGMFDLDGVFCVDPVEEDNDDGPRYRTFLRNAHILRLPGQRLYRIVTSRLEKYRPETEDWLVRAGIEYDRLDMLSGVTAEERREKRLHSTFKAQIYAGDPKAKLFVESEPNQAREIARKSGKPVLDVASMALANPDAVSLSYAMRKTEKLGKRIRAKLSKLRRTATS